MAEDWMGRLVEGALSSRSPQAKLTGDVIASDLTRTFAEAIEDITSVADSIIERTAPSKKAQLSDEAVTFYNLQLQNIGTLSTNLVKRSKPRR